MRLKQPSAAAPPVRLKLSQRLGVRLGASFLAVTLLGIGLVGFLVYRQEQAELEATLGASLLNIARTGVLLVDRELHGEVEATRTKDSDAYRKLQKALAAIQDENRLETPIYTLTGFDAGARQARFMVVSRGPGAPGEPYPLVSELLDPLGRAFGEGISIHTSLYRNQSGTWITGFAPIRDSRGRVIAVLDVDYRVDVYLGKLGGLRNTILGACLIGGLIALAAGALFARRVTGPVSALVSGVSEIARGDLSQPIAVKSKDEVGTLAKGLNGLVDELRAMIGDIISASAKVAGASEELAANARTMADGAEEQTGKTGNIAAAMREMSVTVSEVGGTAEEVTRVSRNAALIAEKGRGAVQLTVEGMRAIADRVQGSAALVGELGERSNQIGAIIEAIDGIADQTNLLALNAAIEAARAGEQGRGFAVVADEVRRLAERTSKATKEIAEMIQAIQDRTAVVVREMTESRREVETGLERAHRAGDALGEIVEVVEQVLGQTERIASASVEQAAATEEVSSHMESVAAIARQTSAGAATTAQSVEELARLAHEMRESLKRFKLREAQDC